MTPGRSARSGSALYVPDEVIVKFKPWTDRRSVEGLLRAEAAVQRRESKGGRFTVVGVPPGRTVAELVEVFSASPLVEYAEPNFYAYATLTPNDPRYNLQWHFDNATYGGIHMEQAWDVETGDAGTVVAVVDTGVAYEDLAGPGFWHLDTYNAYGGSGYSWWCGTSAALSSWIALYGASVPDPPGYGNGWKQYLQRAFDLTSATGTVTFSYYYKFDIERNVDYFRVEVSDDDGASWTTLKQYTNRGGSFGGSPVDLTQDSVDLTGYIGGNILIRFRFNSDEIYSDEDGIFDSDGAVYIDEVQLEDDGGILFYDDMESGAGVWEVTRYEQAGDLSGTSFWTNLSEIPDDGLDNDGNGYIDDINGWDFVNSDAHQNDDDSHGTHVSGTIAQTTNNSAGVAGIAFDATIMPVKVLGADGSGTYEMVADGIYYAVDNGAQIINMSLGGSAASATLEDAVAYAYSNGVTILAASGNSNSSVDYPAAYDAYCIAVGATEYDEIRAPYSNFGTSLDIVAPGGNTGVDKNGDGFADGVLQETFSDTPVDWNYWFFQGTSMATPHASGVAALLLSRNPTLTPDQVRDALESTAEDLGPAGRDDEYGYGLIDAAAALAYVSPAVSISLSTDGSVGFGLLVPGAVADNSGDVEVVSVDTGPADLNVKSTVF